MWKSLVSRSRLRTSRTDLLTPRIFFDEALKSCWRRRCRRRPRVVLAVVLLVVDFRIRVVSLWTRFPVRRTGRPEVVFWEGPKTAPNGPGPARGPKWSFSYRNLTKHHLDFEPPRNACFASPPDRPVLPPPDRPRNLGVRGTQCS